MATRKSSNKPQHVVDVGPAHPLSSDAIEKLNCDLMNKAFNAQAVVDAASIALWHIINEEDEPSEDSLTQLSRLIDVSSELLAGIANTVDLELRVPKLAEAANG